MSTPSETPFESYHKIAESTGAWKLDEADTRAMMKARWVATEKIHGANFSFLVEGDTDPATIRCAKRKAVLGDDESFFGHESVLPSVREPLRALLRRVREADASVRSIQVYGELFGGAYPHEDVPSIAGMQPIQTGVHYCPDVRFCAFDVAVERRGPSEDESERTFMDYDRVVALLEDVGILVAAPLLTGSYQACMEMAIRFDSTLPARLGLPPLQKGTNLAEGVVIKPVSHLFVQTKKGPIRPVIKRKIAEFAEDARFHQARKWSPPPTPGLDPAQNALNMAEWEMLALVNENRLANAISKIGHVGEDRAKIAALEALFAADVWEQLEDDHAALIARLSDGDRSLLRSVLEDEVRKLVARHRETGST